MSWGRHRGLRFPPPPAHKRLGEEQTGDYVIAPTGDRYRIHSLRGLPGSGVFEAGANGKHFTGAVDQLQWDTEHRAWRATKGRIPYLYR